MRIEDIQLGATRLIDDLVKREFRDQGHSLTGAFESSLTSETRKVGRTTTTVVKGLSYGMLVNDGLSPKQIRDKVFPALVEYFGKRGYKPAEAAKFAANTIRKWKQEGMSTQASKRFSKTGARQHFIDAAFLNPEINSYMLNFIDFGIDEEFKKTKNETI